MVVKQFSVDAEISRAETLPGEVYHEPEWFEIQRERIFARSWQLIVGAERVKAPGHLLPFDFLEGCVDEPLLLSRGDDGIARCMSNVCTHRGTLVCEGEGHARSLRCRYHGRRFALDGRFVSMPEFEETANFPTPDDDLKKVSLESWGPFQFCSLDPAVSFDEWIGPMRDRMSFLPLDELTFDPSSSRDYLVKANWALYCDNYLEEFHIPYIHASLSETLDYGSYHTEVYGYSNLQLGVAKDSDQTFDLPRDHRDHGVPMGAYYYWLFPNLMFNFYPWGLSVNIVKPLAPERTRVSFLTYRWGDAAPGSGAGGDVHRVEMEDEEVVEAVQRGVHSRIYRRGRYSPRREVGTHHFHRLLAHFIGNGKTGNLQG